MIKTLGILLCVGSLLGACATTAPNLTIPSKCDPVIVKVPVPTAPPAPPIVSRPALAIDTLTPADAKNYGKVAKAYKASIVSLEGYSQQLEIILDSYRTPMVTNIPVVEVPGTLPADISIPASGTAGAK